MLDYVSAFSPAATIQAIEAKLKMMEERNCDTEFKLNINPSTSGIKLSVNKNRKTSYSDIKITRDRHKQKPYEKK